MIMITSSHDLILRSHDRNMCFCVAVHFAGCAVSDVCCVPSTTVSEADLKRLREAAKRLGNTSGTISRQTFFHDVLGDNVPASQAEVGHLRHWSSRVETRLGPGSESDKEPKPDSWLGRDQDHGGIRARVGQKPGNVDLATRDNLSCCPQWSQSEWWPNSVS